MAWQLRFFIVAAIFWKAQGLPLYFDGDCNHDHDEYKEDSKNVAAAEFFRYPEFHPFNHKYHHHSRHHHAHPHEGPPGFPPTMFDFPPPPFGGPPHSQHPFGLFGPPPPLVIENNEPPSKFNDQITRSMSEPTGAQSQTPTFNPTNLPDLPPSNIPSSSVITSDSPLSTTSTNLPTAEKDGPDPDIDLRFDKSGMTAL